METFVAKGLPSSLYTDRGSHYFVTLKAGEAVDKSRPTQVGRALQRLGVEHIPAYSHEAGDARNGCSARRSGCRKSSSSPASSMWRRPTASSSRPICRFITHVSPNRQRSTKALSSTADADQLVEILCIEEQRVVSRDNTVSFGKLRLQLPQSPWCHHFVKANVKVRQYPDGSLATFHGPRCIGRYDAMGQEIGEPIPSMLHPCSTPSRRGLEASRPAPEAARRTALTASRHRLGAP
ncbi:hypothetical protein [Mesorhizobium sp. M5C.F.Ca.IN.020.29.1.1]|uniref:hypothetical protein n=1 Tax=Mesorhizobium sp. M5C.F.Ca.IN.020.29.1.1 TaxID=2496770 RepID=UPI0019D2E5E5|nr:hypothetical protein [Mesorhizobium sp. M5C.F.Ca.IN.020.29.1.1]